jgi:hypothetical protein
MAAKSFSSLKSDMQYRSKWQREEPTAVDNPPVLFIGLTNRNFVPLKLPDGLSKTRSINV